MICQLVNVSLQQVSYDDDIKILCKCCKEFKEDPNVMFVSKSCSRTNRPRLDLLNENHSNTTSETKRRLEVNLSRKVTSGSD